MRRVTSGVCGDAGGRVLVAGGVVDRTMADELDPEAVCLKQGQQSLLRSKDVAGTRTRRRCMVLRYDSVLYFVT